MLVDRFRAALELHYENQQRETGELTSDQHPRVQRRAAAFLRSQRFESLEVPPSVKAVLTKPSDEDQWENLEKLVECLR